MGAHKEIDAIPEEQLIAQLGEDFVRHAKEQGKSVKGYLKMFVPDNPLPLTDREREYGQGVVERLLRELIKTPDSK